MPQRLSVKQRSALRDSNAFINIADGAIRSGKTHTWMLRFARYCAEGPPGDMGIFGKTERTIKRNVVSPIQTMLPKRAVRFNQGAGELHVFGRKCYLFGANDEKAYEKVTGSTLAGLLGHNSDGVHLHQEVGMRKSRDERHRDGRRVGRLGPSVLKCGETSL